ncbi:DUF3223 domain-containing protein [Brachybacterium sp. MASK1Z-5]|uniref:DUF3223 domain-containing protein n=1 Tax=Brachybacterium halotolerans TaxID=2795215 RepID=A0ABS1BBM2_9MICO|nr:DUF3223 domain-containing protein [Brachybacterium halotolerans]MBK0332049.1 DUF3223 domain-containing protein [Brachybacterium halotolerans]
MTICIGSERFATQKIARARASEVLRNHCPREPITGRDADFVAGLFWCHPRAREKAGLGVTHFVVSCSVHGPTLNLMAVRLDGTLEDFSIKQAVAAAAALTKEN